MKGSRARPQRGAVGRRSGRGGRGRGGQLDRARARPRLRRPSRARGSCGSSGWRAPGRPSRRRGQPGRPELGVQVYWVNNPADSDEVVLPRRAGSSPRSSAWRPTRSSCRSRSSPSRSPRARCTPTRGRRRRAGGHRHVDGAPGRPAHHLRPLLDEANLCSRTPGLARQADPADIDAWYASYEAFLTPYLDVAQRDRVDSVVLAAELNTLQGDPHWARWSSTPAPPTPATSGYAANWDAYADAVDGVPVDTVGIDAYPQLDVDPAAPVAEMTAAWRAWLDAAAPPRPGLLFYEVGAAAETRTLDNPAVPHTAGRAPGPGRPAALAGRGLPGGPRPRAGRALPAGRSSSTSTRRAPTRSPTCTTPSSAGRPSGPCASASRRGGPCGDRDRHWGAAWPRRRRPRPVIALGRPGRPAGRAAEQRRVHRRAARAPTCCSRWPGSG